MEGLIFGILRYFDTLWEMSKLCFLRTKLPCTEKKGRKLAERYISPNSGGS